MAEAGGTSEVRRIFATDWAFAGLSVLSLMPALATRYPQSADYLNHLARLFVLTTPTDHPIHQYYAAHWHLLANLGLECVAFPLTALMSVEAALKVVWCLCILGLAGGTWFLHRSLFVRTQPTLLLASPMLLNLPLALGLLNFTLGVAVMLFATGLWLRFGERPTFRQIALFNLLGGMALICHMAAGAALGLTVGILHIFRARSNFFRRLLTVAAGFVVPVLLMFFQAAGTGQGDGYHRVYYSLATKFGLTVAPFFVGVPLADTLGTTLIWTGIPLLFVAGAGRCHSQMTGPLIVWGGILVAIPNALGHASYLDQRLAIVAALLLVASMRTEDHRKVLAVGVPILAAIVAAVRIVLLVPAWQAYNVDVAEFRRLGGHLPYGAKVLVTAADGAPRFGCARPLRWSSFENHIPTLLVIDRAAFVSSVFADPRMQPILPTANVADYARPNAGVLNWPMLRHATEIELGKTPFASARVPMSFWQDYPSLWYRHYDYLAVRRAPCDEPFRSPHGLVSFGQSQTYRLYRIVKP